MFTPFNGSVTITVLFDTPLPQGVLNVEVFKLVTIPVMKASLWTQRMLKNGAPPAKSLVSILTQCRGLMTSL